GGDLGRASRGPGISGRDVARQWHRRCPRGGRRLRPAPARERDRGRPPRRPRDLTMPTFNERLGLKFLEGAIEVAMNDGDLEEIDRFSQGQRQYLITNVR